jgi:MOSC domain-containing protein YiiM
MAVWHWLQRRLRPAEEPRLVAIYIAAQAGAPMQGRESARALPGLGLEGDRYAAGTGHWRATDGCQLTLIAAEHLARAQRRTGLRLEDGAHRRNLVVAGLSRTDLRHTQLRIGTVVLSWHRPRPPCGYLDQIAGPGMAKALGRQSGHCFQVVAGGHLQIGDRIEVQPHPTT